MHWVACLVVDTIAGESSLVSRREFPRQNSFWRGSDAAEIGEVSNLCFVGIAGSGMISAVSLGSSAIMGF